jgi:hypothetical protein
MGCCLGLLGIWISPRVILFLIWLLSDWTTYAFKTQIYPFLGFLFVPFATLFYLISQHYYGNLFTPMTAVWTVIGLVMDLSLVGGAHTKRRRL